ncbi:polar amino acid transport system substrate-binding protein [Rheinheimera pacifica]|uniref:substrate-binding periplasmic protein n=1 Tax=Rheinheimera pacifica TaxID=173990 RepID=UPI002168EBE9|nr:transporter substrate-binding domain-containing protein [Rheinheimera pacifica]MCS4306230.1 polar amino acid transport system substrate-binding protein [Rheinheimera pacifica]
MNRCYITLLLLVAVFCNPLPAQTDTVWLSSSNYYPHYAEDLPQQGAVSEIIRQAFLLQGIGIEIDFMPFARAYRESQQANYIGLIAAWYDDKRAEHFYYSQPLYANQIVFFKHKDITVSYRDYADLAQQKLRIAVVQGYLHLPGLLESGITAVQVATDEQALQMLARGRVDLVPADKLNGLYLVDEKLPQYAGQLDWMTPALEQRPMYLLLSKKDPRSEMLIQRFNNGLQQLRQSGQYQQIIDNLLPLPDSKK